VKAVGVVEHADVAADRDVVKVDRRRREPME
jgi:hypothetical protein